MSPLDKKLLRDLWRMKSQAAAIAAVIALGVLINVMMGGLINTLEETKRAYYERYRLADVFAPAKRAPNRLLKDIAALPGVAAVEGRIQGGALIDLQGVDVPIRARVLSLPESGSPRLNDYYLVDGRRMDPTRDDEILILNGFAKAHGLKPGGSISATINGEKRTFDIVGLVQAPEYLFSVAPGELAPDDSRFAVIWASEDALAKTFDLDGAFNEALVSLSRGASLPAVLSGIDRLLDPYGGLGAYGLADQTSNRFIVEELKGLRSSSTVVPPIFLAIAAFLLYIVVSRIVQSEREEIGLLKAFGYSNFAVAAHYFKFVLAIATGGALLGCLLGIFSGCGMAQLYQNYFKFPFLAFEVEPRAFIMGMTVSVLAASIGALFVLIGVFRLSPAVAMRPPAPADYSRTMALAQFIKLRLDQPSRMVLRRLVRQPMRAVSAIVGIAAGMALTVTQLSVLGSFNSSLDLSFSVIDRSDLSVSFVEPIGQKAIYELKRIEGVIEVEPFRSVPAILRNGLRSCRGGIEGLQSEPHLNRAVDKEVKPIYVRSDGIILSKALADKLAIDPGETLTIDVREGRRPILEVPVVAIANTLLGAPAYFERHALNRAMKEPGRVSGAFMRIDTAHAAEIYRTLKEMPIVAGVNVKGEARQAFQRLMDEGAGSVRYIMTAIAAIITFGIVYNSARIAFAERARDLASMRVIGFTKGEATFVLLGELGVITLAALPLGAILGYALLQLVASGFSTDLYQIPADFVPDAHGTAALAVIVAAAFSGFLVKRDVDRLDLISVLKTRE